MKHTQKKETSDKIKNRLEYLREEIRKERISYGEIIELDSLKKHIRKNDIELMEWVQKATAILILCVFLSSCATSHCTGHHPHTGKKISNSGQVFKR